MGSGRRVLGRGLDALIPSHSPAVQDIALDDIRVGDHQPRTEFDEQAMAGLAGSIRVHGVIQPLIVTPPEPDGKRRLIAGERRWQAARMAGLDRVPVVERNAEAQAALEIALIENIQREDLSPLEEASAFDRLAREHGLTHEQIAQRVGRSRSVVANTIRLLQLPSPLRTALRERKISEGHARALLGLDQQDLMEAALDRVVGDQLNVRQTEQLVARLKSSPSVRTVREKSPAIQHLEGQLRERFRTKVSVEAGRKAGRIVIEYYSDEELSSLSDLLLGAIEGL